MAGKLSRESYNINAFKRRKSLHNNSTQKLIPRTLSTEADREEAKNKQRSAEKTLGVTQQRYTRKVGPSSNRNKRKSHITDYNHTNYTQNFITKRNNTNPTELAPRDTTPIVRTIAGREKSVEGGSFLER